MATKKNNNVMQYQFANYSDINIRKQTKRFNKVGKSCPEEDYYSFGCFCMTVVSIYILHAPSTRDQATDTSACGIRKKRFLNSTISFMNIISRYSVNITIQSAAKR